MAVLQSDPDKVVKFFKKKKNKDVLSRINLTKYMIMAVNKLDCDVASTLMAYGADPNEVDAKTERSPLFHALQHGVGSLKILEKMVQNPRHPADFMKAGNKYGFSTLQLASADETGGPEMATFVLKHALDPKALILAREGKGETALDFAVQNNSAELVELFMSYGV